MKYMFDSNIFDKLLESPEINIAKHPEIEIIVSSVQIEELANVGDDKKEKRKNLIMNLCSLRPRIVPIPALVGKCRVGMSVADSGIQYKNIKKSIDHRERKKKDNTNDALIASSALKEGCVLVTEDIRCGESMIENGGKAISWEDFWALLNEDE